jgi:hypothetical protein
VICEPAREDDFRIAGSAADFASEGEFGPMECGCCWLVVPFAPHAPSLILLMQRKDAERHTHTMGEFRATAEPLEEELPEVADEG